MQTVGQTQTDRHDKGKSLFTILQMRLRERLEVTNCTATGQENLLISYQKPIFIHSSYIHMADPNQAQSMPA